MENYKNAEDYANSMEVTAKKVLKIIGLVLLGIIFLISIGFIVQALWNWLMPSIFNLPTITYWQGVGLLVLAKILFGGIGGSNDEKKDKSHSPKNEIRGAIGQAIHEEMQQEFKKEFYEKYKKSFTEGNVNDVADPLCNPPQNTQNTQNTSQNITAKSQEELYDTWWSEEGESLFEAYIAPK